MERLAWWLWRRGKRHFEAYLLVMAVVVAEVFIVWPSIAMGGLFFSLTWRATVAWELVGSAVVLLFLPTGTAAVGRPFFSLVRAWVAGHVDQAEEVHRAVLIAPRRMAVRAGFALIPCQVFTAGIFGARVAHQSWGGFIALAVGITVLVTLGVVVVALGFEQLTLPVLSETALALGGGVAPRPSRWGVGPRLLAIASLLACMDGLATAAVTTRFATDESRFIAALATSVAMAALFFLGYFRTFGLLPVLRPIDDLMTGTRRVARGDPTGRLLVTSDAELGELAASFNDMVHGLAERERLHAAFGSYVDPALAERLLAQADDLFAGEAVEVTVFFADVRNFTSYAEHASAPDAVARLNALWDIIVPVLRDHHGHANKFLGDGVLAVFGVPEPIDDHADQAIAAAVAIQRQVREEFGDTLRIGIGINTGHVIAGTIGGGGKLEFTLIGDPVNVAARVEQLTKDTNDPILITQMTLDAIGRAPNGIASRGAHVVRGRSEPINLYALDPLAQTGAVV